MSNSSSIVFINAKISLAADVAAHSNNINGWAILTASGKIANAIATTNALTTSGGIPIKSGIVLFRELEHSIYTDSRPGGVLFYDDVCMDATPKVQKRHLN